jgi:hypothetical protein
VLGAGLEEKSHAAARDGHLEVAVLLVAALVEREGHPRVLGRVHRSSRVLGDMREGRATADARHVGQQLLAHRLELGPDAGLDGVHAGRESLDVEDLEVGRAKTGKGH